MLTSRLKKFFFNQFEFFQSDTFKGLLLIIFSLTAIIIANSQFAQLYSLSINYPLIGNFSTIEIVNDMLMILFFFLIGLEIKTELIKGNLSTHSQRILPLTAAIGGVIAPILIYYFFNYNTKAISGWAIPAATDIAFALGVLTLIGKNIPVSLKIFLMALAIIDDVIAILFIAIFYTDSISLMYLILMIATIVAIYINNKSLNSRLLFIAASLLLIYFTFNAGIHSTIAGVILGIMMPQTSNNFNIVQNKKFESILNTSVYYLILPLFAFVNSGVEIQELDFSMFSNGVIKGIILGLFIGKQIGICLIYAILRIFKIYNDRNFTFGQFYAVSILCGIGFTMSLFISNLAFKYDHEFLNLAKIGILSGSLLSTIFGAIIIFSLQLKWLKTND